MQFSRKGLVWFKNDLRMHDNETLFASVNECDSILPIFIIDPRWSATTVYGFKKTGHFRMQFIYECIDALQKKMRASGSDLYIFEGIPEEIIPNLILKYQITDVYSKLEFGCDENEIEIKIKQLSKVFRTNFHTYNTQTLFDFSKLKYDENNFPNQFVDFVSLLTNQKTLRNTVETPVNINTIVCNHSKNIEIFYKYFNANSKDNRSAFPYAGGEESALARLKEYIWHTDVLNNKNIENIELIGTDYSSKFSPWFAQGCLSVAMVYEQIQKYKTQNLKSKAVESLIIDLYWRDFFYFTFAKYGIKFFRQGGVFNKQLICIKDFEMLHNWISSQTEDAFTNANMQELATTGWMSAYGRRHVANHLSKQLLIDWRIGGAYFESQLLDYDVCQNYGNWATMAGVSSLEIIEPMVANKVTINPIAKEKYIATWS